MASRGDIFQLYRGIVKILSLSNRSRNGSDECKNNRHSMLRLYVKRETAQNKCKYKVPKLLLSEIKRVFILFDQVMGLVAAIF